MEINPNESATGWAPSEISYQNTGLTIRAQIAAMCLQGILANRRGSPSSVALEAIEYADTLIEKLNKTS